MGVDEGLLGAYLDGELAPPEREQVEQWLSGSPEVQARLEQLRQTKEQVHQALAALTPAAPSSAVLAFKRLQAQLEPVSLQNGVPAKNPSSTVWESPSLLAELKTDVKNIRYTWRNTVTKGFIFAFVISLVVIISAAALAVWPDLGYRVTGDAQQVAPAEGVNLPVAEANKVETTTVVVALQPISRGAEFVPGSIGERSWPTSHLPTGFISGETETVGKIARTDIAAGQVIVQGMLVDASAPDMPDLPAGVVPVSAVFNHEIELVGYKLESKEAIDLTLYWRSVQEVANNYTVFIHLTDVNGLLLAQEDSPPGQGKFPTSRWSPGQLVEDEHHILTVENLSDGKYDLKVGLYNSVTGERLSVQSEGNPTPDSSLRLMELMVGEVGPTVPFGYGIQADPNGDAELNLSSIEELGFEWVKFQMPWKTVEPTQGNYDWAAWDQVIDAYAAKNIKVMLSIVKAPDWARPADDDKMVEGPPADPAKYAEFVAQVSERYRGKVQAVEIWDEQNLWYKAGGKGRMNAANYVQLLQQAYPAIKAVNPEMLVISGGLTPAGNVADLAIDDVEYLEQMYASGVKDYFDALGAHPAGYNCPALADWRTVTAEEAGADSFLEPFINRHHSWCFLGTMEAYREVMVANGDGGKAIAITEFGWAVGDSPQPGYMYALDNTPVERARWLVEAYLWGKKQGWVGPMILWNLDYSLTTPVTELGYFSVYYTSAYDALVKMPK
ncbi:MAG: cellulase family glycosylhydrolase [Anaerolineae bacterium]|nr:cellulase family glycosylhydrolase [Anaerolineae bacterium]